MIETRLLEYFLVLSHQKNISQAAKSLYISQSTLSKQMMELEEKLGKQLFIRGKRKITLTQEGTYIKKRAQEILDLIKTTELSLSGEEKELAGQISIGCGETIVMDMLAEWMEEFHSQHPNILLRTYSGNADAIMERIDKGIDDMGLLLGPVRQDKYEYLNLYQKDIYGLLIPADCELAKQEYINIDQLKSLPILLGDQIYAGHQNVDWFNSADSLLNIVGTYNLIYNATFMVEHGIGYALCLKDLVNTAGRNLTFRMIVPELSVDVYIVTKKYQTFSPAAQAFLSLIKKKIYSS